MSIIEWVIWSVDESGQIHFFILLAKVRRRHSAYLGQLVESGHPPFYCFKAQDAFSNDSASL